MKHIFLLFNACTVLAVMLLLIGCSGTAKVAEPADWRGQWAWVSESGPTITGFALEIDDATTSPFKVSYIAFGTGDGGATWFIDTKMTGNIKGNVLTLTDIKDPTILTLVVTIDPKNPGIDDNILVFEKAKAGTINSTPNNLPDRFEITKNAEFVKRVLAGVKAGQDFEAGIYGEIKSEQNQAAELGGLFENGIYRSADGKKTYYLKNNGELLEVTFDGKAITHGNVIGKWKTEIIDAQTGTEMIRASIISEVDGSSNDIMWQRMNAKRFHDEKNVIYDWIAEPNSN